MSIFEASLCFNLYLSKGLNPHYGTHLWVEQSRWTGELLHVWVWQSPDPVNHDLQTHRKPERSLGPSSSHKAAQCLCQGHLSCWRKEYHRYRGPGVPNSLRAWTRGTKVTQIITGASPHYKAGASPWGKGQTKLGSVCNVLTRQHGSKQLCLPFRLTQTLLLHHLLVTDKKIMHLASCTFQQGKPQAQCLRSRLCQHLTRHQKPFSEPGAVRNEQQLGSKGNRPSSKMLGLDLRPLRWRREQRDQRSPY